MTPIYDREWTDDVEVGKTRIRYGLTTECGVPVKFHVQLEYRIAEDWNSDEWRTVARFDHDAMGPPYRNVELVGLHMDVYDPDGIQRLKKTDFPPPPANEALPAAERYLREDHEQLVRRFERWL